ncbi:MAG TPA: 4Fe-4S binding protein [Dehalococcoidia bacterium]
MSQPDSSGAVGEQAAAGSASETLVLLCASLQKPEIALDPSALADWIVTARPQTRAAVIEDLCTTPGAVADAANASTRELVLGLCSSEYREPEVQRSARKAGIDALAIAAVNLGPYCGPPHSAQESDKKAKTLLAAAVARVQAFPGSQPGDTRPYVVGQGISRRALFTMPPIAYRPVASIDRGKCVASSGCNQCVQVCPVEALSSVDGKIQIARRSCAACGICQSACPTSAAQLPGQNVRQLEAEVGELVTNPALEADAARAILFVCRQSSAAVDSLSRSGSPIAPCWLPLSVPCSGFVSPAIILQSLAHGASRVGIVGCGGNCQYSQREHTQGKIDYCQEVLVALGWPPGAVEFFDASLGTSALAEGLEAPIADWQRSPAERTSRLSFAGPAAAAAALTALAESAQDGDAPAAIDHAYSPLGLVSIDASGCTGCGSCGQTCPTGALNLTMGDTVSLTYDPALCTGCAQCVSICPEKVVSVSSSTDISGLLAGPQLLYEDETVRCRSCGNPVAPAGMLKHIEDALSEDGARPGDKAMSAITSLCLACRSGGIPLAGDSKRDAQ